jgi:hypothetical protein
MVSFARAQYYYESNVSSARCSALFSFKSKPVQKVGRVQIFIRFTARSPSTSLRYTSETWLEGTPKVVKLHESRRMRRDDAEPNLHEPDCFALGIGLVGPWHAAQSFGVGL